MCLIVNRVSFSLRRHFIYLQCLHVVRDKVVTKFSVTGRFSEVLLIRERGGVRLMMKLLYSGYNVSDDRNFFGRCSTMLNTTTNDCVFL